MTDLFHTLGTGRELKTSETNATTPHGEL